MQDYFELMSLFVHQVLLPELDIVELRPELIHWSLRYQDVKRQNLRVVSGQPRVECGMTFPTLCLTAERWMDLTL